MSGSRSDHGVQLIGLPKSKVRCTQVTMLGIPHEHFSCSLETSNGSVQHTLREEHDMHSVADPGLWQAMTYLGPQAGHTVEPQAHL